MAEAADETKIIDWAEYAKRLARDPDDHIKVKKYLLKSTEDWDRKCGKFPPDDDLFMRGYLEQQFCRWNLFRGYDFDSIKMIPFPEFKCDGKIDLGFLEDKTSFRYVIGFTRVCDTYDIQFLLHCINFAIEHASETFEAARHARVHINGATHGDESGGYVHVRAHGKKVDFYKHNTWAFKKADERLLENIAITGSPHNCTAYNAALYPLARFIINAWCYSANGYYGGLNIAWGNVVMLHGSNESAHTDMDKKFKELKPIHKDGKRGYTKTGKCAKPKCMGDDLEVRKCTCDACKKVDPKGRFWCKTHTCEYCNLCLPDIDNACTHCGRDRDGKQAEGTKGKDPFNKLFKRFERKQHKITSDDMEKHLEKFKLNDAQTHASNVEIYQPRICTQKGEKEGEVETVEAEKEEEVESAEGLSKRGRADWIEMHSAETEKEAGEAEPGLDRKKEEENPAEKSSVTFTDTDGETIVIQQEGDAVNLYVNGKLKVANMEFFTVNSRTYWVRGGQGRIPAEIVNSFRREIMELFTNASGWELQQNGDRYHWKKVGEEEKPAEKEDRYEVEVHHNEDVFGFTRGGHYVLKKNGNLFGTRNWDTRQPFFYWLDKMRQTKLRSGFGVSKNCPGPWEFSATQGEWESDWRVLFNEN